MTELKTRFVPWEEHDEVYFQPLDVNTEEHESFLPSSDDYYTKSRVAIEQQKNYLTNSFTLKGTYMSLLIISVDIIMLIVEFILNKGWNKGTWWSNIDIDVLVKLGAKDTFKIQKGQVHRLITPMFLHVGLLHLIFNLFSKLSIAIHIEKVLGPLRYAIVYVASSLGGNMLSAIFLPRFIQVGASSSIFGLLAVHYVDVVINWKIIPRKKFYIIVLIISSIFTLAIGLFPRIDNFAHLGGFLAGTLMTLIVIPDIQTPDPSPEREKKRKIWIYARMLVSSIILVVLVSIGFVVLLGGYDLNFCPKCEYFACLPIYEECKL